MNVSLAELRLGADERIKRTDFIDACIHLVLHVPSLLVRFEFSNN